MGSFLGILSSVQTLEPTLRLPPGLWPPLPPRYVISERPLGVGGGGREVVNSVGQGCWKTLGKRRLKGVCEIFSEFAFGMPD